jgi:hypothetical protein
MPKVEAERIRKLEKSTEKLTELFERLLTNREELLDVVKKIDERLGLLEKAHNMTVEELYIWTDMRQDNKKRLRVEEKP